MEVDPPTPWPVGQGRAFEELPGYLRTSPPSINGRLQQTRPFLNTSPPFVGFSRRESMFHDPPNSPVDIPMTSGDLMYSGKSYKDSWPSRPGSLSIASFEDVNPFAVAYCRLAESDAVNTSTPTVVSTESIPLSRVKLDLGLNHCHIDLPIVRHHRSTT